MSRFAADVGPVDRLRGDDVPLSATLFAIVLDRSPGFDGVDYAPTNVISQTRVAVHLARSGQWLRNRETVVLPLRVGKWERLFLALVDEENVVVAFGAILMGGGAAPSGEIIAHVDDITLRHRRPN